MLMRLIDKALSPEFFLCAMFALIALTLLDT